jgi:hypothetical protein
MPKATLFCSLLLGDEPRSACAALLLPVREVGPLERNECFQPTPDPAST